MYDTVHGKCKNFLTAYNHQWRECPARGLKDWLEKGDHSGRVFCMHGLKGFDIARNHIQASLPVKPECKFDWFVNWKETACYALD
jgi:hypothetical protein